MATERIERRRRRGIPRLIRDSRDRATPSPPRAEPAFVKARKLGLASDLPHRVSLLDFLPFGTVARAHPTAGQWVDETEWVKDDDLRHVEHGLMLPDAERKRATAYAGAPIWPMQNPEKKTIGLATRPRPQSGFPASQHNGVQRSYPWRLGWGMRRAHRAAIPGYSRVDAWVCTWVEIGFLLQRYDLYREFCCDWRRDSPPASRFVARH